MKLLIVDVETTGLDPSNAKVIEYGAILYDVEHQCSLQKISTLVPTNENPQFKTNRIPAEATQSIKDIFMMQLLYMGEQADLAVAHNAQFDKKWFNGVQLPELKDRNMHDIEWLCTYRDMHFPRETKHGHNLIELAVLHGVSVTSAHRALTDCNLIAEIFSTLDVDDLKKRIRSAREPRKEYIALVSYEERERAKEYGFRWNPIKKKWIRSLTATNIEDLPFDVVPLEDDEPVFIF